jgi:hypothetical protein
MTKERYIPEGYVLFDTVVVPKEQCSIYINLGKLCAICYRGKQSKPLWHYRYKSEELLMNKVKEELSSFAARLDEKEEWKQRKKEIKNKEMDSIQVGTLLAYSWGYDQTNVEFYQVVEKKGKTFKMRRITGTRLDEDTYCSMSANVIPNKDQFWGDEIITKHSLSMQFGCLNPTHEGAKHYSSWYA